MPDSPVVLLQLPIPYLVPPEITGNAPLAPASLALHARATGRTAASDLLIPAAPILNRSGDAALVDCLAALSPSVVAFSTYLWNIERTLTIASRIRERIPGIRIWLGGPEVASDAFFARDPDAPFDLAVEGEGETVFALLLAGFPPEQIAGLLLPGGRRTFGPLHPLPLDSLETIHDPYLAGLAAVEPDRILLAELYRGCRYRCTFCRYHQGRRGPPAARPFRQVAELLDHARAQHLHEIYLLDPSLEQRADFDDLLDFLARVNPEPAIPLFAELRSDRIDPAHARALQAAGIRMVETGLQSTNAAALRKSGRPTDLRRFEAGTKALQAAGIRTKIDLMLGLPGDTQQAMLETFAWLRRNGLAGNVQVFRTQALPGTRLRKDAARLGLAFDERPPYLVRSTPGWPEQELEQSMLLSEEELGLNLCPDDVPVLQLPAWNTAGPIQRLLLPDTAAVAQYSFDLDQQSGRAALDAEPFSAAGCALSCWLKAIDPTPHIDLMAQAMDRFTLANPFSSLCLALDLAPGMPLDALDALDRILDRRLLSHYIERLHHPLAPTPRPSRRLLAIQRLDLAPRIDADWLDDLRLVSEVVWRHTCRSPDEAVDAASRLPSESDYLLLSLPEAAGSQTLPLGQELFRALLSRAPAPHRIILSGIQLHWNWVRHQTASTGDEW